MSSRHPKAVLVVAVAAVVALPLLGACDSDGNGDAAAPASTTRDRSDNVTPAVGSDNPVFGRIPDIVREVETSVVAILAAGGEGSGVVWDGGTIVTNHHVVAGAQEVEIGFADGRRSRGRVVAADPVTDLAVVDADRDNLPAADFADALPAVGELAVAIGNPLGFENTVTAGIVSGLHRSIPGSAPQTQSLIDLIQTDAPISPGSSGGALVDADGDVIGINVAYIPPAARAVSIGFAIPAPTVRDVVSQLLEDGTVSHAFFGVVPAPLTPQIARRLETDVERGIVVLEVVADGPAAAAGIQPGDVITAVNDRRVHTVEAFLAALRGHDPGDSVTVHLVRSGSRHDITVALAERPPPP